MREVFQKKLFLWILIIALLISVFNYNKIFSPIGKFFFNITSSFRSSSYDLSKNIDSYFYTVFHHKKVKNYIKDLEKQLSERIVDYSRLELLENENATLKQELGYIKSSKYKFVTAEVISGFDMDSGDMIRVNAGTQDGVNFGQPVLYGNGVIIGTVVRVYDTFSDVLLVSDKNSLITVSIQNEEKISGVLSGNLANALEINFIPLDSAIKENDIVITSGFESGIPRGLVVGQVKQFYFRDGDYFKTATIRSAVDLNSLDFVNIMIQQ